MKDVVGGKITPEFMVVIGLGCICQYILPFFFIGWILSTPFHQQYVYVGCALALYLPFYIYPFSKNFPCFFYYPSFWKPDRCFFRGLIAWHGSMKKIETHSLKKEDQHIFLIHPHGVFIFSRAFLHAFDLVRDVALLAASVIFCIPFCREIALSCGAVDARKEVAQKVLSQGSNIFIAPGGIKEQLCSTCSGDIILVPRKGGIRLGLQHGCTIVPSYCFGELQLFDSHTIPALIKNCFYKYCRISLVIPSGFWGTLIPRPMPLTFVTGKPIKLPKMETVDEEMVQKFYEKYVEEILNIYDKFKHEYGQPERKIKFYERPNKSTCGERLDDPDASAES